MVGAEAGRRNESWRRRRGKESDISAKWGHPGAPAAPPIAPPTVSDDTLHLFDGLTLDLGRGSLLRGGVPVHLRPQSYGVLVYLVGHRGRLVSKDELLEAVWEGRAVTDGALGKCIEEVREALGVEGRQYLR